MDRLSSRWHKPKSRSSKKRKLAAARSAAKYNALKNTEETSSNSEQNCIVNSDLPVQNSTRSEKKLNYFKTDPLPQNVSVCPAYTIVHDDMLNELFTNLSCESCGKKELKANNTGEFGYSTKLQVKCLSCKAEYGSTYSSPRMTDSKRFEINKNMVKAFLNIGKGHASLEIFSMTLGIQTMDRKTFDKCVLQLVNESVIERQKILEMARAKVREEHLKLNPAFLNSDIIDIGVSFDGSWHKRGHSSLYCVGYVIDILTGLVIDYFIVSKYCHDCTKTASDFGENSPEFEIWYEAHYNSGKCEKNYDGSSASMEAHAAGMLWKRSIIDCKMRYTVLLSDGDSKTFQMLTQSKVYGDKAIIKDECLNHVAKRLGTALRNKVKEWRVKGICLGAKKKGNLTEEIIIKLTNYYRKAVKDNVPDLQEMKTAIFSSLYHCMSTNNKPQHHKCPPGKKSWCFFNRALASGSKIPDHCMMKTKLSESVVSKILPVYQRLASDDLLSRCTSGKTQNSNESIHSLIWKLCPKDTFVSKKRVELAAISAVSQFNMGCVASLSVNESKMIRSPALSIAKKRDRRRLNQSLRRDTQNYKTTYRQKKFAKKKKEEKKTEKEGITYAAGAF